MSESVTPPPPPLAPVAGYARAAGVTALIAAVLAVLVPGVAVLWFSPLAVVLGIVAIRGGAKGYGVGVLAIISVNMALSPTFVPTIRAGFSMPTVDVNLVMAYIAALGVLGMILMLFTDRVWTAVAAVVIGLIGVGMYRQINRPPGNPPAPTAGAPVLGATATNGSRSGVGGRSTDAGGAASSVDSGPVLDLPAGPPWKQVSAGGSHACALANSGAVFCWGANTGGEVGLAPIEKKYVQGVGIPPYPFGHVGISSESDDPRLLDAVVLPVAVPATARFATLSAGNRHTCAITADSKLYCWGEGLGTGVGDGTTQDRVQPVRIANGLQFAQVSAGFDHTCALTVAGEPLCWGSYRYIRGAPRPMVPTVVPGTPRLAEIGAGDSFSCGRTSDGEVYCWGWNEFGQLGDGTDVSRLTPGLVVGAPRFVQLAVGANLACGRTAPGEVYCWGMDQLHEMSANALERCDSCSLATRDARLAHVRKPELVPGGQRFAQIAAGGPACGRTARGEVYCWGSTGFGSGGGFEDSTGHPNRGPAVVRSPVSFADISVGSAVACGITPQADVYCWGANENGGLGNGKVSRGELPTRLGPPIPKAKQ